VGGTRYILLPDFFRHQRPHIRERASEIPPPTEHRPRSVEGKPRPVLGCDGDQPGSPVSDPVSVSVSDPVPISDPGTVSRRAGTEELDKIARRMFADGISRNQDEDDLVDSLRAFAGPMRLTKDQARSAIARVLSERRQAS
jgi:hypothetical protein